MGQVGAGVDPRCSADYPTSMKALRSAAILLVAIAALATYATAQTPTPTPSPTPTPTPDPLLVYNLELKQTGRSVNYAFFEGGYLVVDTGGSSFNSIIILSDPNTFTFYQASGFVTGTYNTILDYTGNSHAVLFGATAGTTASSDNAALQLEGDISENRSVGGGQRANLARRLRGYLLASGAQSSGNSTFTYGFAGTSEARARINLGLTRSFNSQGLTSSEAVTELEQLLVRRGIPGPTPTPSPSPSPTPVVTVGS